MQSIVRTIHRHSEWILLLFGLILMGAMNPAIDNGFSFCIFDLLGFSFCPGDGLGHSIAYTFRGELSNAMQANVMGPLSIIILTGRIGYLLFIQCIKPQLQKRDR